MEWKKICLSYVLCGKIYGVVRARVANYEGLELGIELPQRRPVMEIACRLVGAIQYVDLKI